MAASAIASMTGFARFAGTLPDGSSFVWELRSVNGRGLDVRFRLPNGLDALEPALREAAGKALRRGNVNAALTIKHEERGTRLMADEAALAQLLTLARDLAARIPGAPPPRAEALLALPGVLRSGTAEVDEAAEETRRVTLSGTFGEALTALSAARRGEGARLAEILTILLDEITVLHARATVESADQPAQLQARLREQLAALLEGERRVPEERLAAEVALLATKADVREELDRLGAHIAEAGTLLRSGDAIGRRLEFLTQEFVREANTLCSKSASLALTRTGLDLKAAIERLREQAANVE